MGKGGARKKMSLTNRAKQVRQVTAKEQRKRASAAATKRAREERIFRAKAKAARVPYLPSQHILLVGEGDFSFTRGLLLAWENASSADDTNNTDENSLDEDNSTSNEDSDQPRIMATCLDSKEELFEKYPHALDTLEALIQNPKVQIVTEIDCRELEVRPVLNKYRYDRIVFQFPHTGCGEKDTARNNAIHRELLIDYLSSAATLLKDSSSEIHITVKKGEPYDSWGVNSLANEVPGLRVKSSRDFFTHLYPGYTHRRTVGAALVSTELGGPSPNQDIMKGAKTVAFCLEEARTQTDGYSSDE